MKIRLSELKNIIAHEVLRSASKQRPKTTKRRRFVNESNGEEFSEDEQRLMTILAEPDIELRLKQLYTELDYADALDEPNVDMRNVYPYSYAIENEISNAIDELRELGYTNQQIKQLGAHGYVSNTNLGEAKSTATILPPSEQDMKDAWDVFRMWLSNDRRIDVMFGPPSPRVKKLFFSQAMNIKTLPISSLQTFADYGRRPKGKRLNNTIVVIKMTGSKYQVLDGQHRVHQLRDQRVTKVNATVIEFPSKKK